MSEDPAAMLFLQGMLPGGNNANNNDESANLNELSVVDPNQTLKHDGSGGKQTRVLKNVRVKTVKRKVAQDAGYKWPYYDSYAPGLGMNKEDKRIVRRGVIQQYFPNDKGNFNNRELRHRSKGIKDIE